MQQKQPRDQTFTALCVLLHFISCLHKLVALVLPVNNLTKKDVSQNTRTQCTQNAHTTHDALYTRARARTRTRHIDASSEHEATRAIAAGINPSHISLSAQELPPSHRLHTLLEAGVLYNACSLLQLAAVGKLYNGQGYRVGIRVNPGLGSGGTGRTNVGGPDASFGIWYELLDKAKAIAAEHNLVIERIHTHIGSGTDPKVWNHVSNLSLDLCRKFTSVVTMNLGGGFKVNRMPDEKWTNVSEIGGVLTESLKQFAAQTGRELKLEIEPGTFMLANSGVLLTTVYVHDDHRCCCCRCCCCRCRRRCCCCC